MLMRMVRAVGAGVAVVGALLHVPAVLDVKDHAQWILAAEAAATAAEMMAAVEEAVEEEAEAALPLFLILLLKGPALLATHQATM